MAQHDYLISDASGTAFLADLNVAMAAVVSGNSGNSAPSTTYPYMVWNDTLNGVKKERNASNTAWVTIGALSAANLGLAPLAGATFTGPVSLPSGSTVSGYLPLASAGMRNLLINANPIINQRGWVSGTSTTSANQFTLDRWFVVTSGQSISWSDSAGVRTVTAPAGGVAQVIEGSAVTGTGTHVLSWTGTATATVNGAAVSKGVGFTLTGGANATVRFSGGTFASPQLEPGSIATSFEKRPPGLVLMLCQRYYQELTRIGWRGDATSGNIYASLYNHSTMRVAPSIDVDDISLSGFGAGVAVVANGASWLQAEATCNSTAANCFWVASVKLSAELTS